MFYPVKLFCHLHPNIAIEPEVCSSLSSATDQEIGANSFSPDTTR